MGDTEPKEMDLPGGIFGHQQRERSVDLKAILNGPPQMGVFGAEKPGQWQAQGTVRNVCEGQLEVCVCHKIKIPQSQSLVWGSNGGKAEPLQVPAKSK